MIFCDVKDVNMFKRKVAAWLVGMAYVFPAFSSMNIQPDPQVVNGYLLSRADLQAVEKAKTANPMYEIWAQALRTTSNLIVEAIEPGLATNPDNVKRVERVFPEHEWDFLTHMAAPEYTYTRFLRAIGKFPAFYGDYS